MITAAFTDGEMLICAMPSERKNGLYLAMVRPERDGLLVTHSVSGSTKQQRTCIKEAVACYYMWRWWKQRTKVTVKSASIVLQPHWIQIPVPGTVPDIIQQIGEDEWHAAEYFGCRF
ncbi:hypothetical protein [Domibacillus indicus]|uniref:hypothetical protein n=1 Tax=Domibacillus indicus TaxID=1437523 RepID=UPI0006182A36|nr:hypothetical protein [Domibacillus indicus]